MACHSFLRLNIGERTFKALSLAPQIRENKGFNRMFPEFPGYSRINPSTAK